MNKFKKTIANLSSAELVTEAKNLREEIRKQVLDKSLGKLKNMRAGFIMRKKLAVILTKLNKN